MPCRPGCSRCCIGPFAVTALDARELQGGLATLPVEIGAEIRQRARRQAEAMATAAPRLQRSPWLTSWSDDDLDRLLEKFADTPCPALASDGDCLVYPFRPITCRMMGVPVEANGVTAGACEVQTALPIVPLPSALRREEEQLAAAEARALEATGDEELLLPHAFLPEIVGDGSFARSA